MKNNDQKKTVLPKAKPKNPPKNPTSWEPVAGWYDELLAGDDTYQSKVILPNLLRLLEPKGKKIIDIACGQGFFSKLFAEAGADEVLGVDISPELIKKAKEKAQDGTSSGNADKQARFEVSPADDIRVAKSEYFNTAVIVLAIQNIKEMNATLKEASRVLTKGGELILVLNHPCFRIPKATAWGYDDVAKVQYRRVDKYGLPFSIDIDMTPGAIARTDDGAKKIFTKSFHRPLQDYFKALVGAGFQVAGLEEWISHKKSENGPRAVVEDSARKEFPMFLMISARKN